MTSLSLGPHYRGRLGTVLHFARCVYSQSSSAPQGHDLRPSLRSCRLRIHPPNRFSTCQGNLFTMSRNTCRGCLRSIQERAGMSGKNAPALNGENSLNQNRKTPPQRRRRAIEMGLRGLFQSARERIRTSTAMGSHVTLNHALLSIIDWQNRPPASLIAFFGY